MSLNSVLVKARGMICMYIKIRIFSWASPNCSCVLNLNTRRMWTFVWMLKPVASHLAADDARRGWVKRLHRAPLKPSSSWRSLNHKTGRVMLFWLCRGDSRSAGRTSSSTCEQMCCCSGSYSLNDQSHQHKAINQHEPFRAPGAPEPRGPGAGASVAWLVIQRLEHIELRNVHRRGYLWACWVIICRSCRGSRLRAADGVMKTTCRRRRTPDPVGVFLYSSAHIELYFVLERPEFSRFAPSESPLILFLVF